MTIRQNALRRTQACRTPTPVVGAEHTPECAYGAQSGAQSALYAHDRANGRTLLSRTP